MDLATLASGLDTVWVVLTAAMILLMEGGFALLEAGFVRQKNAVSIIMKVFVDITFGALIFYFFGFAIMYGKDLSGLIGTSGFFLGGDLSHIDLTISHETYWLFQCAFVIAVISIVSGAVAERINFHAYILFTIAMTGLIYPIAGHWVWSIGGWLGGLGMIDFAGSAVIHALGGFAALAAAVIIGPRIGKFTEDGTANIVPPSNLPLASVGAFILWFGWFGFNSGSTLSATNGSIGHIALTTMLAASAGGATCILFTMLRYRKSDPPMVINGSLAGLVGITAGCAFVSSGAAILIGAVCGIAMVFATEYLESKKIDDPVGAFAVHGVSGSIGTLAVGLFAKPELIEGLGQGYTGLFYGGGFQLLGVQALGLAIIIVWGFATTWVVFKLIRLVVPVRVSRDEELVGLDVGIHGVPAYSQDTDFIELDQLKR
ncbi:ammonium transporter [Paenibacillus mucilaginosus]|uniref:Ammonium transporter n=2 Tax=Paenibacillus mucilaginosus TaxID=61624 RepID=H6NGC7_9BACL|nr:ammonium transporter [Paenibacillus mucilaginosus]AEI45275.1 ammonium transporter [Paenibacillus mucilaginosus KNP414]AFC33009.1 ammonium transporter [Paenibacillus mucilaginosus 3016]MCG7212838.1 ammonium transporter [Paenibacillus mucilaginosus]WDM26740.1 ammonium transporter [Paenibacillus mucilaginosus]WFA21451.1 ammonium transporter [Paenibacillus mucilaginosus]